MSKTKTYLLLTRISLCILLCFTGLPLIYCQDESLKVDVQTEFDALKVLSKETQSRLEFDYTEGASSESRSSTGVLVINIPELKSMISTIGMTYKKDLIRMLVSHEFGHQIQYRFYGNKPGGLLYECQADIIAGFLIYQLLENDVVVWSHAMHVSNFNDRRLQEKLTELNGHLLADFSAIFSTGTMYVLKPSHPTNEERRMAMRDGFTYGNIWLYGEKLSDIALSPDGLSRKEINDIVDHYKQVLNFFPGDNLVIWSLRHAKKILHSFLPNGKNIVVYTDYKWDTSRLNPFLYYNHKITNIGTKTLTLNFYNQLYVVKRDDPENTLYWSLLATNSYSISLQPGQFKELNGQLKWNASKEYMPTFVYLGRDGSLYSCTSLSDENESEAGVKQFSDKKTVSEETILDVLFNSTGSLPEFIGSIGRTFSKENLSNIEYISRIRVPSAEYTNIVYDLQQKDYSIEISYYTGKDRNAAEGALQRILHSISKVGLSVVENPKEEDKDTKVWDIGNLKNKSGEITFTTFRYNSSFDVHLEIFGARDTE